MPRSRRISIVPASSSDLYLRYAFATQSVDVVLENLNPSGRLVEGWLTAGALVRSGPDSGPWRACPKDERKQCGRRAW